MNEVTRSSDSDLLAVAQCPTEDQLVAMIEGALSPRDLAVIERHVAGCDACAEVLGSLGALGEAGRPRTIDRYQLDRRIAAGGMGEVWAAWDPQLRREVAIKLVRPERADDTRERERLLREARALAKLRHPNVIAVHDVGEIDGEVFIISELVTGDTLATRGGPTAEWRTLVALYAQAARGLAAAHAAGLVHRDVKPANLLLGTDGRVRVADFGLAVRAFTAADLAASPDPDAEPAVTQRGHIAGTPAYMAPEQRAGIAGPEVDQFALCVALGEAITGKRPPMDIDLVPFVRAHRAMDAGLEAMCAVLSRGLALDPAERFADMTALADALDAISPPLVPVETSRGLRSPTRPPGSARERATTGRLALGSPAPRVMSDPPPEPPEPSVLRTLVIVFALIAVALVVWRVVL